MAAALTALALAALLLVGGPVLMQERMLYFPARVSVAQASAGGLQPWPAAQDFRGLLAPAKGEPRGTAVVFHGNAGHAGQRAYLAQALGARGLRVMLVDDAAQSIDLAHRQFGAPLLVVGESLGAGVAAAAAARQREQVAGLMLITPWDRLEHVASFHYPWLPVKWLLRDRYDSVAHLAGFGRPVVVAVAAQDDIVPERFGRALHAALPEPRLLLSLPQAGHNDWPAHAGAAWWQQAVDFMLAR